MKLVRILSEFQENSKSFQSLTDIATPNKNYQNKTKNKV